MKNIMHHLKKHTKYIHHTIKHHSRIMGIVGGLLGCAAGIFYLVHANNGIISPIPQENTTIYTSSQTGTINIEFSGMTITGGFTRGWGNNTYTLFSGNSRYQISGATYNFITDGAKQLSGLILTGTSVGIDRKVVGTLDSSDIVGIHVLTIDYENLPEGRYTFKGKINNTEEYSGTLVVDITNPATISLTSPVSGASIISQILDLSRIGFDFPAGISGYKYTITNTGGAIITSGTTTGTSISLSTLTNGQYIWNVTAYDKTNHQSISENRTIYYQKPILGTVSISGYTNYGYTKTTGLLLLLTGNKAINYLITGNILTQNNGIIPDTTTQIQVPINLSTGDGLKTITTYLSNTGDTTISISSQIYLDQTNPTISLYNPTHLSTYNTGTINFSWNVTDNSPIKEIRFYLDDLSTPTKILSGNSMSTTISNIGDASHAWKIEATDIAGNTTGSATFVFTTNSATPTITNVENGKYYNTTVTPIINGATQYRLNGVTYTNGTPITGDGTYTLVARNIAGNQTQIVFTIDKTTPTITITNPTNNSTQTSTNTTFQRSAQDANISGYTLTINGTNIGYYTSVQNLTTNTYTISNLPNGSYTTSITVYDRASNQYTTGNSFNINTPLNASVSYSGVQIIGYTKYANQTINITVTPNKAANIQITGDITTPITQVINTTTPYTITYNGTDGRKNIYITLTTGGAVLSSWYTGLVVYTDTTSPTIPTITSAAVNTGTFSLTWTTSTDGGAGVKEYLYSISSGSTIVKYGTVTTNSVLINNMELSNGTYVAAVQARDYMGNASAGSTPSTFTYAGILDTIPDSFSLDKISNAELDTSYTSNSVTITGLSNNTSVLAYINEGKLYINGTYIGTTGYVKNGDYIQIKFTSSDEYDTTVSTTVTVGNQTAIFKIQTIRDENSSSLSSNNDLGDIVSLTTSQKLQVSVMYNALAEVYTDSSKKSEFMLTFKSLIKERIQTLQDDNADEQKIGTLQYLYQLIDNDYSEDITTHKAPNGKTYTITYDENKGYTSANFTNKNKYFSSLALIYQYIDKNNSIGSSNNGTATYTNVDTTRSSANYKAPNGKYYKLLKLINGRYGSYTFQTPKTFGTLIEMKNYINKNNPK